MSTDNIFLKSKEKFERVSLTHYENENEVEKMIVEHPNILPFDLFDSEFIPLSDQMDTGHGPLDILGTAQSGDLYIIETKLYKNPDKRTIRSQLLDYAAGLNSIKDNFDELKSRIDRANKNSKYDILKNQTFDKIIQEKFPQIEERNEIIEKIKNNFNKSHYILLAVSDKITVTQKETIKFLNEKHPTLQHYAISISRLIPPNSNNEIVISNIFPDYTEKTKKTRDWREWTRQEFYDVLEKEVDEKYNESVIKLSEALIQAASDERGGIDFGFGAKKPSFNFYHYDLFDTWAIFIIKTNGSIIFKYRASGDRKPYREGLLETLNEKLKQIGILEKVEYKEKEENYTQPVLWIDEWADKTRDLIGVIKQVF